LIFIARFTGDSNELLSPVYDGQARNSNNRKLVCDSQEKGEPKMAEYIREVEKEIDELHKQSSVFSLNRKTALFNALTVFEDSCRLGGTTDLALREDSLEFSFFIREQLDALNVLIQWIYHDCPSTNEDILDKSIISKRYLAIADLLQNHAKPYSPICSAYISYSRGYFSAQVNEKQKTITFLDNPENRGIVISDMMESIRRDQSAKLQFAPTQELFLTNQRLVASIRFREGHISYSTDDEIWNVFQGMMERQWMHTSELPEEWQFDTFSIKEFKHFWIVIATLCIIHMRACLKSDIPGANVEEAVIVKTSSEFTRFISQKADIPAESISAILTLLTYNNSLKNNDIVYQPFVSIDKDILALAPHLILASRPERNLISLIHKLRDKSYFNLTNLREGIMQEELTHVVEKFPDILVAKNKPLPDPLPDVDYAIWEKTSNTVLVCELKWLVEADSTPEVFARIQDIERGCDQISNILIYAQDNHLDFCNRIFGNTESEHTPQIMGCVVSKKGIRVNNTDVPVISTQTLLNLFQHNTVREAFEVIKNRTYFISAPHNFEFGLKTVCYAGYAFEIPALLKDQPIFHGTYKRVDSKIGRNDPCPCGSGKKYKKCCGR
jgi:hypothetical protein